MGGWSKSICLIGMLALPFAGTASAQSPLKKAGKKTGDATADAAKATGKATEKGAKATRDAVTGKPKY